MYTVYCDNYLLYHSNLENLKIINPSVELELNKTGSFDFTIYPNHPYYNMIKKLKSIITVYQDDYPLFRGRVLDDEIGWNNRKAISCEGDMAFLLDSVLRPFTFTGTLPDFLAHIINNHNSQVEPEKRFVIGNVTVNETVSVDVTEHINSYDLIYQQSVDIYGGYLMTRTENGVTYLDYLAELNLLSPQTIRFGQNLLDLNRIRKGDDIATVVIPLGAKLPESEQRLTITAVNDGVDYLEDTAAISQFGTIVKTTIFDDVTDAAELKRRGQAYLADSVNQWETVELSAADLATVDKSVTSFHLGTQVKVETEPHGINQLFTVSKLSIQLLAPASNRLVLGKTINTFSKSVVFQKGDPGQKGEPGLPGSQGQQGVPGKDGKDGYTPVKGVDYFDGANGKDGVNGKDGKDAAIQSLTAPSDTSFLWLDISVDPPLLKRYDTDAALWVVVNDTTAIVYNLEQNFKSEIEHNDAVIRESMYENIYLKDDVDKLVSETSAHWERTATGFEMEFVKINKDVADVVAGVDAEFEEIRKYIRYVDGKILLGEVGNELELAISNDRISFLQDGAEVAYFSNRKLYVTDVEILHGLQLGSFSFMPRNNGNLSFKRIH